MTQSKNQLELWKKIVFYLSAVMDCESDAETKEQRDKLHKEKYEWLISNFIVRRKPNPKHKMPNHE